MSFFNRCHWFVALWWIPSMFDTACVLAADASKFAHSDGDARYLHHITLYDANNRKITPDSTTPYSTVKTCGRCHDYESISHGWHFSALLPDEDRHDDGRSSEPWIWTDTRIGTQLPLSARRHPQRFSPTAIGISSYELVQQFGGRLPGTAAIPLAQAGDAESDGDSSDLEQRWALSGAFEIDCMVCHAIGGGYDINQRREQISEENFAWAPTAALRLGAVSGKVSRIKTGTDVTQEPGKSRLPVVEYDARRFNLDGTVFFDLVRKPENNACYQCHSQRQVGDDGIEAHWLHDQDVHLRAGMNCVDCHRNGIDHDIVRGFEGQDHPAGSAVHTLSCTGCHLGTEERNASEDLSQSEEPWAHAMAGRLGSPEPLHQGLPPIHFEKLSCTACHSGPPAGPEARRWMTSFAHGLGEKGHRTGAEWPSIQGPVYVPLSSNPVESSDLDSEGEEPETQHDLASSNSDLVFPQRGMWPAYFASFEDGKLTALPPNSVYEWTRKALRVRKDFVSEVTQPKLSRKDREEALGEDAGIAEDDWNDEQRKRVLQKQRELGWQAFDEKILAALESIQSREEIKRAAYVSSGQVFVTRTSADLEEDGQDVMMDPGNPSSKLEKLVTVQPEKLSEASQSMVGMLTWPIAHDVRGSGRSLGAKGCIQCHSDQGYVFTSTIQPIGPAPISLASSSMAKLRGVDEDQRLRWNQLFSGRATFKWIVIGSLLATLLFGLMGIPWWLARPSA